MEKQDILNGIASIKYKFTLSSELVILGALACLAFYEIKKSAKLVKSAIEKRNPKKHRLLSVAICDWKHVSRIPRPKVGASLKV